MHLPTRIELAETIAGYKTKVSDAYATAKDVLRDTAIEVVIGGALGLTLATGAAYNHEADRANRIPVAFSERSQLRRDAAAAGKQLGPVTEYLTATNDATMKVFESWNIAHEQSYFNSRERFARELETKMDPAFRIHKEELYSLLPKIPRYSETAKASIRPMITAGNDIRAVHRDFETSWDDSHVDHYRTETYTETETYSCGTSDHPQTCTRLVAKTRQVYDYTTHTYEYNKEDGEKADKGLKATLTTHTDISFKEQLPRVKKTQAENEYAMDKSRKFEKGKYRLDVAEYTRDANLWNAGSTIKAELPNVDMQWKNLHNDSPAWNAAKRIARSDRYNTSSHSDSGPEEFQVAERTAGHSGSFVKSVDTIVRSMDRTASNASALHTTIKEFIAVELDHKSGDSEELEDRIMALSKDMYKTNFSNGFDVDRFRFGILALMGLLGTAAGAAAGAGVDKLGQHRNWYGGRRHTLGNFHHQRKY